MAVDWGTATDLQLCVAVVTILWGDTAVKQSGTLGNLDWWQITHKTTGEVQGPSSDALTYSVMWDAGYRRTLEEMILGTPAYVPHTTLIAGPSTEVGWVTVAAVPVLTEPRVQALPANPLLEGVRDLYRSALTIKAPDGPIPSV